MKQLVIFLLVALVMFVGLTLFFTYVVNVSSSFKLTPSGQNEGIKKRARETELQRTRLMEDYDFKMEQLKRSSPQYPTAQTSFPSPSIPRTRY